MIRASFIRFIAISVAAFSVALLGTSHADAASWPFHSTAGAWCDTAFGHYYMHGNMPAVGPRDEALGTVDSNGGTPSSDEWIYYRLAIGYNDSSGTRRWDRSPWDAVLNRYQGGGMIYELLNGGWQQVNIGGLYAGTATPGTTLEVPKDGDYVVYGEYWWGAIPGFGWLGPLYEYLGTVHCSAD